MGIERCKTGKILSCRGSLLHVHACGYTLPFGSGHPEDRQEPSTDAKTLALF